ncbi:MAG: hypothetical protein P1U87_19470 [Verrucomicrobiales bacterium]|nr:hypothetical protein [Verrucomicrobiales bacterium]
MTRRMPHAPAVLATLRRVILVLTLLASVLFCSGAGKKYKLYLVTFHLEAEKTDNPKMITPVKLGREHRQYFFNKIPTFTDHDIQWFFPFTSDDGVSYGAAFKLKDHALTELKAITLTNQGKLLGLRCSDAPLEAVLIDRPITDGVVVVWNGLQQRHLQEFRKRFPHVDDLAPPSGPEFNLPGR